jgi:hypothetical protein
MHVLFDNREVGCSVLTGCVIVWLDRIGGGVD